jgi:uncharacterized protein (DUF433 family)
LQLKVEFLYVKVFMTHSTLKKPQFSKPDLQVLPSDGDKKPHIVDIQTVREAMRYAMERRAEARKRLLLGDSEELPATENDNQFHIDRETVREAMRYAMEQRAKAREERLNNWREI